MQSSSDDEKIDTDALEKRLREKALLSMKRKKAERDPSKERESGKDRDRDAWLPDGYSQISRLNAFGPSGLKDYGSTTLRCKI